MLGNGLSPEFANVYPHATRGRTGGDWILGCGLTDGRCDILPGSGTLCSFVTKPDGRVMDIKPRSTTAPDSCAACVVARHLNDPRYSIPANDDRGVLVYD